MTKELIIKLLKSAISDIENDKCGLDEEEIIQIASMLTHKKITLEQVCHELHISRATLNRRIKDNIYPQPRKDPGGKKYYFEDEIFKIKI